MKAGFDYTGVTVSFFCHDGKGNFLLHKRSQNCRDEQGAWDFGGGKLEFGEDFIDGVLREIREEYGLEAEIEEHLPAQNMVRQHNGQTTHWVSIGFIARIDPLKVIIGDPESMDELAWHQLDALPAPLHTGAAKRLKALGHIFEKYQ